MPESDPTTILLAHDRWATMQILLACEPLSAEQFAKRFEMGPGSLQDLLTHVAGALRAWTDSLSGRPRRPRIEDDGVRRSTAELRPVLTEAYDAFDAEIRRLPLAEVITHLTRTGLTFTLTRGAVLAHVTTHGMHHRAQALNMLRHLGVQPLPPSSVTEWTLVDG